MCLYNYPGTERPASPFGGMANDARWMSRGLPPNNWLPWCVALAAVDMPLSLAGDIVTLPYTVPYMLINIFEPTPEAEATGVLLPIEQHHDDGQRKQE
jgi:hypothetical protein